MIGAQDTTVAALLDDLAPLVTLPDGDLDTLRKIVARHLTTSWDDGYDTGEDDAAEHVVCDRRHFDDDDLPWRRVRDAAEALHTGLHDRLPIRACLHECCQVLDGAIAVMEAWE